MTALPRRPPQLPAAAPRLGPLALAVVALFAAAGPAAAGAPLPTALPGGLQVVQGQATLTRAGQQLTVSNSANAVLNWQQFSIGAGSAVHFAQPTAASKVLNRVLGNEPSAIFGSLSSNGQVWLLNPHGVLFGPGARVDVAGLLASTLRLGDADWAAGRLSLAGSADAAFGAASVVNQGELRTVNGGRVLLIGGGSVRNEGLIEAPDGQLLLAAGRSVELVDSALPHLAVRLSAPQGEAVNLGTLRAGAGRIDLQAALVNQQGIVQADRLGPGRGGEVVLAASSGATLGAGSLTSAGGDAGGRIHVDGGSGRTQVAGTVSARGGSAAGGSIALLGRQVGLLDGALADASGAGGGGAVRVGGGLRGQDAAYRNAEAVYLAPGASIVADATRRGDGGLVVLWSARATRAYGTLSARGGALGGDGGFIETSGGWLDARPRAVHTAAPAGRAGQWLLDPHDLLITDDTGDTHVSDGPDFSTTGDTARLSTETLAAALSANNNVTVTTGQGGEGDGDITVSDATLRPAPTAAVSLTLRAVRDIRVSDTEISSQGAPLTVRLVAGHGGGLVGLGDASTSNGGAVRLEGVSVNTRGGDIGIGGNSVACSGLRGCDAAYTGAVASSATGLRDGVALVDSTLDAGSGSVTIAGHSLVGFTDSFGVLLTGSSVAARSIAISGSIDAPNDHQRAGVAVFDSTLSATQRLAIVGSAGSEVYRHGLPPVGVDLQGETLLRIGDAEGSPTARLTIQGSVNDAARVAPPDGEAVQPRYGVALRFGAGLLALGGAGVDVAGDDLSPNGDPGVYFAGSFPAFVDAARASQLTLRSAGNVSLSGDLRAPDGGTLTLRAGGRLLIDDAQLGGNPSQVTLSGSVVDIGGSGATTRLQFGAATRLDLTASQFLLGAAQEPDSVAAAAARRGAAGAVPARVDPAETQAVVAVGGVLRLQADEVQIGASALLQSDAAGDAIILRGQSAADNTGRFLNFGGEAALAAPNGRWLLFAREIDDPALPFQPGGLRADFHQYAASGSEARPAQGGNGFLFAAAPVLSLSGEAALHKLYDGGTALDLRPFEVGITGLRAGDQLVGGLHFADKNAGTGKPLLLAAAAAGNTAVTADGVPVYGYRLDGDRALASITPRALSLLAASVADKRYDGGTAASVAGFSLGGVLPGDELRVQDGSAAFADAGVGSAKPVTATVLRLAGADAGNYLVDGLAIATRAAITPAPLLYLADTVSAVQGQALPVLGGTVTGFVAGETLASATTGVLRFGTSASADGLPGRYAVEGSGLAAANYSFAQAPGNASALTLQPAPPPPAPPPPVIPPPAPPTDLLATLPVNPFVTQSAVDAVLPPAEASTPGAGRALDALQAVLPGGGAQRAFASLDLEQMTPAAVAAVLAARDGYKKAVFQRALQQLEQDPALADAPGCASAQQAASGQCLVSTSLASALAISNARVVDRTAAAPAALPEAAPAPAARPPAVAGAPAPTAAAVMLPPRPLVDVPARRGVATAALPQIQRKFALLIGIDQYDDARIPRLGNAVGDAQAVAALLETRLGYQTVLLPNANRAGIFRALNQLLGVVGPADSVLLYYAGHGERAEKTGLGYWQPADADPMRPETWISNADIDRLMRQLPASQVAMISDSCFSGSLVSGERIRGGAVDQDPGALLSRRAAVVMTSGGNEPVFDAGRNGHSPFAWNLMQSLQQVSAWKPGSSLFEQVRFAVARQLPQRPQYAAAPNAGHQSGADYLFEQRQLGGVVK